MSTGGPTLPTLMAHLDPLVSPRLAAGVSFEAAELAEIDWSAQQLRRLSLDGSRLLAPDLTGAKLRDGSWTDVEIKGGLLAGLDVGGAAWRRVALRQVRADGLIVSETTAKDVLAVGCKFDLANFRFAKWSRARFEDCSFKEADFMGAELTDVTFVRCNLTQAQFSGAKLKAVDMRSSQLAQMTGLAGLAGATVALDQLMSLAPDLANELGIIIAE
jgi:uncharacterized protein YjbI with pentapeptide repeats